MHAPVSNPGVTEAWFAIRGANLNLDDDGRVDSVWDARYIHDTYQALCEQQGVARPNVIRR
ncbi:hypothetical protein [Caldimonas brevitalea]|uniref:Uncharacterized protein n=1 Tax=Caldimonas brevitalea TaxID=413882 RepID=A0A0G3BMK0_9BURK|nr:hypothetical protein [Caldimonas brevitalea]AKJ28591.1 hypothetical protein AAW51_1900 [Caldimonas brevitalea]